MGGGVGPFDHSYKKGEYSKTWHRNGELIEEEGHATDLIVREATAWLTARKEAPFFLYVPFTAVHLPLKEATPWLKRVPAAITGDVARHYAACIMHLDESVGQIVATLEKTGQRDNTLVVVTSDNGGTLAENNDPAYPPDGYATGPIPGNNAPLRGHKTTLYEGGIRVAALAHWPGKLISGKFQQPMHIVDWMPTFCRLAGYTPEKDLRLDGRDVWPLTSSPAVDSTPRVLYFGYGRGAALRSGDWKLIVAQRQGSNDGKVELFNLASDPGESVDLSSQQPASCARCGRSSPKWW